MVYEFINLKIFEYMEMYGQAECNVIMERLNNSKLFHENLQIAIEKQHVANGETINNIIHGLGCNFYFLKKRKIYFASLLYLRILYEKFQALGIYIDEHRFMGTLLDVERIYEK